MKSTSLLLILVAFGLFSCTNDNAPLTQQEKEKLTAEVNTVMNSMMEGIRNLDASMAFEATFLLDNDFKYIDIYGKVLNSESFMEEVHNNFDGAEKVNFTFSESDIRIVNSGLAIVTLIYHGTFYFPESTLTFPDCGSTLVLEKTEDGWKVIHFHESLQASEFLITER